MHRYSQTLGQWAPYVAKTCSRILYTLATQNCNKFVVLRSNYSCSKIRLDEKTPKTQQILSRGPIKTVVSDRWYRQPKYVWDREHETSIQTIQSLHGVQMVAWPLKAGEDMIVSISVTEAMALSAALRTSCEHPGFTMLFTFVCGQGKNWSANTLYHFWKGKKLTTKLVKYLLQVLLQLFDSSHVVSIFNTQWNRLCLSTQSFKLKWPRVSVHVFHQEAGRILSQQSGKQNLSTRQEQ